MSNSEWTLSALHSLIQNNVEENLNLDYKAADALGQTEKKKKEVAKDISAMANSAGGTIIYGIKEFSDASQRHLPEKIDPIIRSNISKEWIEQVINSNIQPKVDGIIITPVTIEDEKGTVVYVVDIPQSSTAHQASDKRYYKRYNFESVAMNDYEIRDIMGRLKNPDITLEFILEKKKKIEPQKRTLSLGFNHSAPNKEEPKSWFEYQIKVAIRNKGKVFANYVNYYLEIPSEILYTSEDLNDSLTRNGYKEFYGENTLRDIVDIKASLPGMTHYKYGPSRYDPILPGTRGRFEIIRLIDNLSFNDIALHWTIYADNADIKTGSITLIKLQGHLKDELTIG